MANEPKAIIVHCTDYSYRLLPDQLKACDGWHRDRGFPVSRLGYFIGYHRLITNDKCYKTREDSEEGAHCNQQENGVSMNFQSLGVCIGFDGDVEFPTPKQYALLQKQIFEWQDTYKIPNERVFFHRHFATEKSCPGSLITNQWLKDLLTRPQPVIDDKLNTCLLTVETQKVEISRWKALWQELLTIIKEANK